MVKPCRQYLRSRRNVTCSGCRRVSQEPEPPQNINSGKILSQGAQIAESLPLFIPRQERSVSLFKWFDGDGGSWIYHRFGVWQMGQ